MSYYRRVDCRIWGDAKFRQLSDGAKIVWFRLLTGPETTILPGFLLGGYLHYAEALGWEPKRFGERFGELLAQRLAKADWEVGFVWVPNAMRYHPPENPNQLRAWMAQLDMVPECELQVEAGHALQLFLERLGKPFAEPFAERLAERFAKRFAKQQQDQDQEQDQEKSLVQDLAATPLSASADVAVDGDALAREVAEIYHHYLAAMGKTEASYHLTPKRRTRVIARLRKWDTKALKTAIDACALSPFHMGTNDRGTAYNDLADHILKSDEKVEWWLYGRRGK